MTDAFADKPIAIPESIDMENHVIATYWVKADKSMDMSLMGQILAIEQTTGTWVPVPGETPEVRAKHVAKVIGVYEAPSHEYGLPEDVKERQYILQIAFPAANVEDQLPMLLTATVGNISLVPNFKLLDLRMPKATLEKYQGPRFGIDGWYEALGIEKNRPIMNNMIKPCSGYPLEVGARLFREVAMGGCDVIKDDELIANMCYNSAVDRVKTYMEIERQVYEETGEHTLYTVNVTDRLPRMFDLAKRCIDAGANAMMVNYLAVGPEAMRALAEDPEINVPILAHMDVGGAYFMSPYQGISSPIIFGKIPRLCGADSIVLPFSLGGKGIYMHDRFMATCRNLTYPFGALKPVLPMPSGGITPANVPDIINSLGREIMIGSGGGIHAHPRGPTAGVKAFRQAIDAVLKGIPIEEYSKEHEELGIALGTWQKKTEFKIA
ncbi:MAG TPA: RuBisCO large subunit C-terminal-like domain-containing protein [Deltaproteobacteria bacterium]|nr:RuBisCO large subunit C-terminal-like domain-containing protein [Deltaproteobacteria bacterium]HOS27458.1 RuBisCO large subunit C-terminal-like domain-containing protein [Deltaproteobacteria bacterium]